MEREILKSGGVLCQRVQVRYAFVASQRTHYPTRLLCRVLGVSVSGFHDYLRRQCAQTCDVDSALRTELRAIHVISKRSYGRRRLVRALRAGNHPVGHKRVARLMAEERIRARPKADSDPSSLAAHLSSPPTCWIGNLPRNRTDGVGRGYHVCPHPPGWLHLAVVISVQTRQVLGYSVSKRLTEELVVKAFANAWALHPQRPGLIFHSDRGGQYWGNEFRQLLQSHGVVQSMSRPAIAGTTRWPRASLRRSRQKRLPSLTPAGNKPASPSLLTSTASTIQPGYTRRWATTRLTTTPGSSGLPPETASWRPFSGARSDTPYPTRPASDRFRRSATHGEEKKIKDRDAALARDPSMDRLYTRQ